MEQKSLPVARQPADILRYGLTSMQQEAQDTHPVEAIQRSRVRGEFELKMDMAQRVYGSGFAMRLRTEAAALSQAQRLPGLLSSRVGLETVLGNDETLDFEDFMGTPENQPGEPKFKVHEAMEIKYGLL
ncbi:proteasome maturation factor UMP1 [Tribonema minus]|uniref:Proteasome maturation factor UMP1 n=1 Tax=Tribonema minus TaxID=303371 RepID=A0A835YZL3_9STRA|nr:proteasome maturation factor UMP1 [Tribonema minus]